MTTACKLLISTLLSLSMAACEKPPAIEKIVEIHDFYDHSYINNNIARGSTFFGTNRYRFLSYYDTRGRVILIRRDLLTEEVVEDRLEARLLELPNTSSSLLNPHNFISGGLDVEGHVHLVLGTHNSRPHHYVSCRPLEPGCWEDKSKSLEHLGRQVTYPHLLKMADGALWLFYRDGRAGKGDTYVLRGLRRVSQRQRPLRLIAGMQENSQYLFSPLAGENGCVHLAWTWRLSDFSNPQDNPYSRRDFQGVTNRDIAYALSCDKGETWTDSNGRILELPLLRKGTQQRQAETIARIDIGTGFFNHYGGDLDAAGKPHYVLHRWDDQDRTQIWHLYRGHERWEINQVSRYRKDIPWNRHQANGLAATSLARPELLVDRKTGSVMIVTRSQHFGNRLELYRADPCYEIWRRDLVNTGSLGGWEPQLDKGLFHATDDILMLLNSVRDERGYSGYRLDLNPEQQAVLARAGRGERVLYADYSILYPVTTAGLPLGDLRFNDGEAWIARLRL